jgi:hypothetical protein
MIKVFAFKIVLAFSALNASGFSFVAYDTSQNLPSKRTSSPLRMINNNRKADDIPKMMIPYSLNTVETMCMTYIDDWYSKSLSIKCPFFRRRMADLLDALDMVMRFLIIRHKSLDLIGPPPGCRSTRMSKVKHYNLNMDDLVDTIRNDWREDTNKGYYINGRLNTTIYRDDCFFNGPDPDMPVRGLRKYLNAASQLFDHTSSTAKLLDLKIVDERNIVVEWELEGVLHLPWHPKLPVWTGRTSYHFDEDSLIYLHEEVWDISVLRAFTETLLPEAASLIWRDTTYLREGDYSSSQTL